MINETNRLRQSQRLELIGTVASGVAHDLNNQLTVILNHLEFAVHKLDPFHPVLPHLLDVQRAAGRCAEMTSSLLAFGARTSSRFQRLNLQGTLEETARLLRRVIPATIDISLTVDPLLETVMADATQIQQILVNLSINSRDAMPQGGILEINAANRPGGIALTVRDNGAGIPAHILSEIFEPFFTTKGSTGGSGLGLAMVKAIVEEHGGSMTVESDLGAGTLFSILLPSPGGGSGPHKSCRVAGSSKQIAGERACILIADDDDLVREVAKTALSMRGYRIIEARDGEEAVNLFRVHAEEIDLLFLDMTMPRVSGSEALARIQTIKPSAKALFTSGYEVAAKNDFLAKPYTSEGLARKVDQIIRSVN